MAETTRRHPRTALLAGCYALRVILSCLTLPSRGLAQDAEVGAPVQPAPEVRLTGVLAAEQGPRPSAFPALILWIDGTRWRLQVNKVEAIIPANPAEQELQKVSGLGLRGPLRLGADPAGYPPLGVTLVSSPSPSTIGS